jgi:MSHA pilin protein MshC
VNTKFSCATLSQPKNPPRGGFLPLRTNLRGFTMVELIVTIMVIGILAVNILPRWSGNSGFDERSFRDRVVAGLRYAQKSAIASRRTVCASFSSPPASVTFMISTLPPVAADCTTGAALVGPENTPLVVTAPGTVNFAALPADVIFDAAGRPAAGALINVSGLAAALVITVEAETGYVH